MRADDDVDAARLEAVERSPFCSLGRAEAAETSTSNGNSAIRSRKRAEVLLGEDRRRHEHRDLLAVVDRLERGPHRQLGLAVADVAAEQPVHRPRALHVVLDLGDRA